MENYISIKQVLDDVLDHPLLRDVSFERAVNYTLSFMRIVGCPKMFCERTQVLHIKDYRAPLPCDYEKVIQIRMNEVDHRHRVFRNTTDSFHMSEDQHDYNDLTYKIQGSIIFTSIKEGDIEIAYHAIKVDQDGYPMVPDNSSYIRALELYIKKQCFTILFDLGKITPAVYNNVQQEYAWAVGQAQSELVRPTIDEMQAITNAWNTLIPRMHSHGMAFKTSGSEQIMKRK